MFSSDLMTFPWANAKSLSVRDAAHRKRHGTRSPESRFVRRIRLDRCVAPIVTLSPDLDGNSMTSFENVYKGSWTADTTS